MGAVPALAAPTVPRRAEELPPPSLPAAAVMTGAETAAGPPRPPTAPTAVTRAETGQDPARLAPGRGD